MKFFCCTATTSSVKYGSDCQTSPVRVVDVASTVAWTTATSAGPFIAINPDVQYSAAKGLPKGNFKPENGSAPADWAANTTFSALRRDGQLADNSYVVCPREDSGVSDYKSCYSFASCRNSFTSCASFDAISRNSSLRHETDALLLNDTHVSLHTQLGAIDNHHIDADVVPSITFKTAKTRIESSHTETPRELISCIRTETGLTATPVADTTDASTNIHEQALQRALDMYKAHGHPCAACQALLEHCNTHGITAEDLGTHLEGFTVHNSMLSGPDAINNPRSSKSRSMPAACMNQSSTPQQEANEEADNHTTPSPRVSRPQLKHSGSSSSFRRAASSSTNGALPEDEMGLDERDMLHGSTLHRLVMATVSIENCVHQLLDDTGWQVVRNDLLKLMYQHKPGTSVHSFKARCILESPIEHLVALTREFDLCSTWNTHCKESVVMKEWSFAEVLVAGILWLPWPLPYAQLVLEAVGTDLLEMHGGFLVTFHTPDHMKRARALPGVKLSSPKNLSVVMRQGSSVFFEPLLPANPGGPPRTRTTIEVRCDVGLKNVPTFVITFVLKVLAPFIYNMAVKLLAKEFKDPSRPIPARIHMRPDLYGLIRRQAAAYLANKKA